MFEGVWVTFIAIAALAVAFGFGHGAGSISEAELVQMCEKNGYYNVDQVRLKCSVEVKDDL